MSLDDLGEVLAGTPAEMDRAIIEAVGLPYEQFTSCVVLPQGQFADFLHAKPATRQQILVNLLGLHVYEEVQTRRPPGPARPRRSWPRSTRCSAGWPTPTTRRSTPPRRRLDADAGAGRRGRGGRAAAARGPGGARTAALARDALDAELTVLAAVRVAGRRQADGGRGHGRPGRAPRRRRDGGARSPRSARRRCAASWPRPVTRGRCGCCWTGTPSATG